VADALCHAAVQRPLLLITLLCNVAHRAVILNIATILLVARERGHGRCAARHHARFAHRLVNSRVSRVNGCSGASSSNAPQILAVLYHGINKRILQRVAA